MEHLWLNGWGIYHLMDKAWVGQLWQSKLFLFGNMPKDAGFQGSTLSDHCMTTGFGPFELPTCGLLQRGWDHSPPKACFYSRSPALSWLSKYYV